MKFIMTLLVLMSLLITEAVYGNFGPPTNITATPGDGQVTLSWTHPSDINKEEILPRIASGSTTIICGNLFMWLNIQLYCRIHLGIKNIFQLLQRRTENL